MVVEFLDYYYNGHNKVKKKKDMHTQFAKEIVIELLQGTLANIQMRKNNTRMAKTRGNNFSRQ